MKKISSLALLAAVVINPVFAAAATLYQDPYCGCCSAWAQHMQSQGVAVAQQVDTQMAARKDKLKVPAQLRSCHTALIGGYVFEGHVPADLVKKVLRERPKMVGLAVPGMPLGSPGMEGASRQPYQVLAFDEQGRYKVYAQR